MDVAVRGRHLEVNPFAGLQLMPVPERMPEFFATDGFARFLSEVNERWLMGLIIVAVSTDE
jgi:hypothetical protein